MNFVIMGLNEKHLGWTIEYDTTDPCFVMRVNALNVLSDLQMQHTFGDFKYLNIVLQTN